MTALIYELQRERGMSAGFISTKGQSFADALRTQRQASDRELAGWQKQGGEFRTGAGKVSEDIEKAQVSAWVRLARSPASRSRRLRSRRRRPPNSTATRSQPCFRSSTVWATCRTTAVLFEQSIALAAHVRRKEFAGQERATGSVGFGSGEFAQPVYLNFLRLKTIQDLQAALFRRNAKPDQVAFVEGMVKGPVVEELTRLRDIGAAAPFNPAAVKTVAGPQWFEVATKYIDILKVVEDRLLREFTATVDHVVSEVLWGFWSMLGMFLAVFAVTGTLAVIVALSITRPIADLVATMRSLAGGDLAVQVHGTGRGDEVGDMAQARRCSRTMRSR